MTLSTPDFPITHYLGRLAEAGTRGDAGADEWAAAPQDLDAITAAEATLAVCQVVLRGIAEADYARATVCPEFSVAHLADHLIGSVTFVGGAAGAEFPPTAATTLEARVAAAAQPALEAWNARFPDGLDGPAVDNTVKLGQGEMPATSALGILSIEFLVHAWDFAQATGQQVTVPEGLAAFVLDVAGKIITPEVRSSGSFADAVPVGPDAHVMDRLIAFTGRTTQLASAS